MKNLTVSKSSLKPNINVNKIMEILNISNKTLGKGFSDEQVRNNAIQDLTEFISQLKPEERELYKNVLSRADSLFTICDKAAKQAKASVGNLDV